MRTLLCRTFLTPSSPGTFSSLESCWWYEQRARRLDCRLQLRHGRPICETPRSSFRQNSGIPISFSLVDESNGKSGLLDEDIALITKNGKEERCEKDDVILAQGSVNTKVYWLSQGKIAIMREDENGAKKHLSSMTGPTLFGLSPTLTLHISFMSRRIVCP